MLLVLLYTNAGSTVSDEPPPVRLGTTLVVALGNTFFATKLKPFVLLSTTVALCRVSISVPATAVSVAVGGVKVLVYKAVPLIILKLDRYPV